MALFGHLYSNRLRLFCSNICQQIPFSIYTNGAKMADPCWSRFVPIRGHNPDASSDPRFLHRNGIPLLHKPVAGVSRRPRWVPCTLQLMHPLFRKEPLSQQIMELNQPESAGRRRRERRKKRRRGSGRRITASRQMGSRKDVLIVREKLVGC